jgi:2-phosphosulfolactate phosphatase
MSLEVLFAPAEFEALAHRDLSGTECVVLDILRATSTMVSALANGAEGIVPVSHITEALRMRNMRPDVILGGERDGVRIGGKLTGGVDFDLGNSPREYAREKVSGKLIVSTTTNGTRALRACARAKATWIASFLNLGATADALRRRAPEHLLFVCSGTHDQAAYEDVLGAGGLCDLLWTTLATGLIADSAQMARRLFTLEKDRLGEAISITRNGKRLMAHAELREDVAFCAQIDRFPLLARMDGQNIIRMVETANA